MRIIRVFPRQTNATPDDDLVRIGVGPGIMDEADEVHVSVTFTWDLPLAEKLVKLWKPVAQVKIGGPATGEAGKEFVPGMYVKKGYVITSRGCNNRCWFCSVWKREGNVHTLSITEGSNVLDDNLLSCPKEHIKAVFDMLKGQKDVQFTGGLEAKILEPWHVELLKEVKTKAMFFAYDTPDDYEHLVKVGKMLIEAGFPPATGVLRAYVLCGFPKDSVEEAHKRMIQTVEAGFMPMAMLYRDKTGSYSEKWRRWQRQWARPAIIASNLKRLESLKNKPKGLIF